MRYALASLIVLLLGPGATTAPLSGQGTEEIDSGRFRIRSGGGSVATEVFAIRREPSSVRSVARLTAGSDTAVFSERITEARLQTNPRDEPVLFELEVQRGGRIEIAGVRSGDRFRLRTRSPDGERWREYLVPSGLVVLPEGFVHFHHFLLGQHEDHGGRLTALFPVEGSQRPVGFRGSEPDTLRVAGERRVATRWEIAVGEQRRLIWSGPGGRILRVEIPARDWVAERVSGSGPRRPPSRRPRTGGDDSPHQEPR